MIKMHKVFNFINLPKVLRSKDACNNLPFNCDISDIPKVVFNLNPCIRSTIFNYKQFMLHLNIDELLKHLIQLNVAVILQNSASIKMKRLIKYL